MPTSFSAAAIRPSPLDLNALVRATRAGDSSALGALYDQYADVLYHAAYRLLGSRDDAQDIVHDCFVGLPEALRRYEDQGRLDAWLKRIVVRMALMRRRKVVHRREDGIDTIELPSKSRTDSAAEFSDVQRAITALPESLRDVFVLNQVEGYSHDEIAQLLDISAGASRVRLARALDSLRRTLAVRP